MFYPILDEWKQHYLKMLIIVKNFPLIFLCQAPLIVRSAVICLHEDSNVIRRVKASFCVLQKQVCQTRV